MQPLVSVIIPTKNSSRTLVNCLESIKNQSYKNIEIIVVDNFSTDGTYEMAKKYSKKSYQKGPERTTQKNYGIGQAVGEYVCFIDSDMMLEQSVILDCVTLWKKTKEIGGICIPERTIGDGLFVKIRDFERSFYGGTAVESARFFYRDDVINVGSFEEDLVFFEESLLPQKVQFKLGKSVKYRIESYISHDESDIRLGKWLKKKYYYGQSLGDYRKKVKEIGIIETAEGQMSIVGRYTILLSNSRFYTRPILALGVLVLKTMEFGAGGLGLLYAKIRHIEILTSLK